MHGLVKPKLNNQLRTNASMRKIRNLKSRTITKRKLAKPHEIECERLKEIIPTVADCKNVNEVQIIREAIKHIDRLEQEVVRRLSTSNPQFGIPLDHQNLRTLSHPLIRSLAMESLMRQTASVPPPTTPFYPPESSCQYQQFVCLGLGNLLPSTSSSTASTPYHTEEED